MPSARVRGPCLLTALPLSPAGEPTRGARLPAGCSRWGGSTGRWSPWSPARGDAGLQSGGGPRGLPGHKLVALHTPCQTVPAATSKPMTLRSIMCLIARFTFLLCLLGLGFLEKVTAATTYSVSVTAATVSDDTCAALGTEPGICQPIGGNPASSASASHAIKVKMCDGKNAPCISHQDSKRLAVTRSVSDACPAIV
eukprot:scaffold823_cov397-Prasinococcus_capsulatus_cf.AAC.15